MGAFKGLRVAMIGLGTVESVPVFHYHPGGTAVRLRLEQYADDAFSCVDEHEICIFSMRGVMEPEELGWEEVLEYAATVRADMVVFEGPYAGAEVPRELVEGLRSAGITVAFRTMLLGRDADALGMADIVVVDYPLDYVTDPGVSVPVVKGLSRLAGLGVWVEANVYLEKASPPSDVYTRLYPVVAQLSGTLYPLHVHVRDHGGGGPVRDLYEKLRRRLKHVYIHTDTYRRLDTYCPSCGAHIATRDGPELDMLNAPGGRCWKCGSIIPLHGRIRERTPPRLLAVTGGVRWMHPRLLRGTRSWAGRT